MIKCTLGFSRVLGNCCHHSQQLQAAEEHGFLAKLSKWLKVDLMKKGMFRVKEGVWATAVIIHNNCKHQSNRGFCQGLAMAAEA